MDHLTTSINFIKKNIQEADLKTFQNCKEAALFMD